MGLMDRMRDLVAANLNAMIDRAEDPEKMVNQYLRDLSENQYEAKTRVAAAMADETKLHNKMVQFQAEADQWQVKAEAALRAGDEDLARQALARKLQSQKLADQYKQQYESQDQQVEELQNALVKLEARIAEAKSKRDLIIAKRNRAETQEAIQRTVRGLSSTNAMDKLAQLESRVDDQLAQADAMARLEKGTLEARFADLEADQELNVEMEALRRKMSGQA
ncbi:MAG: PspA/IM30 family protein [Chloroflexota bacterium]|nr:PspA/IM30 family protein [Chloroflexota bacterium]PLS78743.1 MAG: phage shock protein A [Chloroflexota bacterium]